MELQEVGMVLARVANFDNRRLDPAVARDWKVVLDRQLHGRGTIEDAMEVVLDHFAQPDPPYFTVGLLVDGLRERLRLTPKAISDDVRSAKARGLLPAGHDPRVPLPVEVAERLAAARAADRESTPAELEVGVGAFQIEVGRRVDAFG